MMLKFDVDRLTKLFLKIYKYLSNELNQYGEVIRRHPKNFDKLFEKLIATKNMTKAAPLIERYETARDEYLKAEKNSLGQNRVFTGNSASLFIVHGNIRSERTVEVSIYGNKREYVTVEKTIKTGITFGSCLAMVIPYSNWHSILWTIIHGLLGWIYVIYFIIFH